MSLLDQLIDLRNREACRKLLQTNSTESLEWREVRSLFSELGQTAWQANGDFKVTSKGHVLILRPARNDDVAPEERVELRRFLEQVERSISNLPEGARPNWGVRGAAPSPA